jgi:N6-adenosine-specific RNA methylase IME4
MTSRPISDIKVGTRHRKDMGDIAGFAASIADVGLLQPICVRPDGTLIDGGRRLEACRRLGWTEIPVHEVDLDAIVRGEFAANAHRKDFLPSEIDSIRRALEPIERAAAERRMTLGKISLGSDAGRVRDKIGTFAGVSGRTVEKIAAICQAAEAAPARYSHLVAEMDDTGNVDRAFKQVQILARQEEHAKRVEHGCTVADLEALAASGRRFAVVYADPAWPWETFGPLGRIRSCADHHYGLATIERIKALPVAPLATDDAVLVVWGTWPRLPDVLQVIAAWGFTYKTCAFVWVKTNATGDGLHTGMGYFTRSNSEFALLATKGAPRRLAADVHQVIRAPVGEHSAKPEEVRRRIERLFSGPYLELYGRASVEGWTVWGR